MSALGEVIRRLGVFLCIDHLSVIWMDADSAVLYLIHCRRLLLLTLCQSPWSSQLDIHSWYDTYSLSNLQMNTPVCSGSNFEWHFWSQWHEFYLYTLGEKMSTTNKKEWRKEHFKTNKKRNEITICLQTNTWVTWLKLLGSKFFYPKKSEFRIVPKIQDRSNSVPQLNSRQLSFVDHAVDWRTAATARSWLANAVVRPVAAFATAARHWCHLTSWIQRLAAAHVTARPAAECSRCCCDSSSGKHSQLLLSSPSVCAYKLASYNYVCKQ